MLHVVCTENSFPKVWAYSCVNSVSLDNCVKMRASLASLEKAQSVNKPFSLIGFKVLPIMFVNNVELKRSTSDYRKKLSGVIDMQIHLAPDIVQRSSSEALFEKAAREAQYFGWLSKCHHLTTAGRQVIVTQSLDRPRFFGSVALNNSMGGLNAYAVEVALKLGASEIWMPTLDAQNHISSFGKATIPTFKQVDESKPQAILPPKPITVLDTSGQLKEEAKAVLEAMKGSEAILGTGHLSYVEIEQLIDYSNKVGIKHTLITHPEFRATNFSKEQQKKLVDKGSYLEHCATTNYDARLIVENIRFVGASHCILSSDSGQAQKGHPLDAFYDFIEAIRAEGIDDGEIQKMTIDNPKKLLGVA
jgi:hypothetical protein